ncbi:hypothetical protein EON65_49205 [archaeon]|nr:MAG: hypothetical protein EON65_49205 [archaeon]
MQDHTSCEGLWRGDGEPIVEPIVVGFWRVEAGIYQVFEASRKVLGFSDVVAVERYAQRLVDIHAANRVIEKRLCMSLWEKKD